MNKLKFLSAVTAVSLWTAVLPMNVYAVSDTDIISEGSSLSDTDDTSSSDQDDTSSPDHDDTTTSNPDDEVRQPDPQLPVPAETHTLTFIAPDGSVMAEMTVSEDEDIDYSQVDTSSLRKHINVYTEQDFHMWDKTPARITEDTTIQALIKTAEIKSESLPTLTKYASTTGDVSLEGLKVQIYMRFQTPEKDSSGKYIEENFVTDISSSCVAKPATLDQAFSKGDKASISIFPIGQDKSIASYTITTIGDIGDVDGNKVVDGSDATLILKCFTEMPLDDNYQMTEFMAKNGDINKDGIIDGSDATHVLRFFGRQSSDDEYTMEQYLNECGIAY